MKKIFLLCGILIFVVVLMFHLYLSWVILPIGSTSQTLTLEKLGYPEIKQITMKHYINDVLTDKYILNLNVELRHQIPQKYSLPKMDNGRIEIDIDVEDMVNIDNIKTITINYPKANDLFDKGLLIVSNTDFKYDKQYNCYISSDQYIYCISGTDKKYYFEKAGSSEWTLTTNAPQISRLMRKTNEYATACYDWKEKNTWDIVHIN